MTSPATDVRGTNTTHFEPQNPLSTGNPHGASADSVAPIGASWGLTPSSGGAEAGSFSTAEMRPWTAAPPNVLNLPESSYQIPSFPALGTSTQDCPWFTSLGPSEVQRARFPERIFRFDPLPDRDPLDITRRLAEFKELQVGWASGMQPANLWGQIHGKAPPAEGLDWLAERFSRQYSPPLTRPYLYPTPEGGVQAEWSLGPNEASLEIDLTTHHAEWHCLDVPRDLSFERELDLDNPADWKWLAQEIRRLGSLTG